jgi:hypothetical protein
MLSLKLHEKSQSDRRIMQYILIGKSERRCDPSFMNVLEREDKQQKQSLK